MPAFEYEAQSDDGRSIRDTAFGGSLEEVIQSLALKGLLVTKIQASGGYDPLNEPVTPLRAPEAPRREISQDAPTVQAVAEDSNRGYVATSVWGPLVGQVDLAHLALFFRQLASMAGAGVPLVSALDNLSKQSHSAKLGKIVAEMRDLSQQGRPISDAMQRYPEVFQVLIISMVRAGEEGGFLEKACRLNSEYLEQEVALRALYRKQTAYPKLVIFASIVVISAANMIIHSLGKTGGIYSPLTDPSVMCVLVPAIMVGIVLWRVIIANPRARFNWDIFLLKVPYVGTTVHQFAMAKFGRAFGALYKGGIPVQKALSLSADSCGNELIRSRIASVAKAIEEGKALAPTLQSTGVFDPLVLDMVNTGELAGSVDAMLDKVSDYYEAEAKVRSEQLGRVTGFVALLAVAVYVGYIVISFFIGMAGQIGSAGSG